MSSGNRAFYEQREAILAEIGVNFEHVLMNINKLNRSLEGVIAVGNEFGSVEALWSQFENVMGKEPEAPEQAEETVVETKEEQETAEDEDMTETIEERKR